MSIYNYCKFAIHFFRSAHYPACMHAHYPHVTIMLITPAQAQLELHDSYRYKNTAHSSTAYINYTHHYTLIILAIAQLKKKCFSPD